MSDPRRDDRVLFTRFANRAHEGGAHGGRLYVTTKGVTFRPHWFDRRFVKAPTVTIPWSAIAAVEVAERDRRARRQGGDRRRLEVARRDGTAELFIVNRVGWVRDRIREIQRELHPGG